MNGFKLNRMRKMSGNIELNYKKLAGNGNKAPSLVDLEIIAQEKYAIILGAPGSGKSTTMKELQNRIKNSLCIRVNEFLEDEIDTSSYSVILLDAYDEYYVNQQSNRGYIIDKLLRKASKNNQNIGVIIACREAEWESTKLSCNAQFEEKFETTPQVYLIQPFNKEQQKKLAQYHEIDELEEFLEKFGTTYLNNPLLNNIITELYKDDKNIKFNSLSDVYDQFITHAIREFNGLHISAQNGHKSIREIRRSMEYMALFHIFCNCTMFDDTALSDIGLDERGYSLKKLKQCLSSKVFTDKIFIHRSVSEYLAAHGIKRLLVSNSIESISIRKIASLFLTRGEIPSALTACYAWCAQILEGDELLKLKPLSVLQYGDINLLTLYKKKILINEICENSSSNPYFMARSPTLHWADLYEEGLDVLLMQNYNESYRNTHVIRFIATIISRANKLSADIRGWVKYILDNQTQCLDEYIDFITIFNDEPAYLIDYLDKIKDGIYQDSENRMKTEILEIVYPKYIDCDDLVPYLISYEDSNSYNDFRFLLRTPPNKTFGLLLDLHQSLSEFGKNPIYSLPDHCHELVRHYLSYVLDRFEIAESEPEKKGIITNIYQELIDLWKNYDKYSPIDVSFYSEIKERFSTQELGDRLADLHFENFINSNDSAISMYMAVDETKLFFPLYSNSHPWKLLIEKANNALSKDVNKCILWELFGYKEKLTQFEKDTLLYQIQDLGLMEEYKEFLSKPKRDWEVESKKRSEKYKLKTIQNEKNGKALKISRDTYFNSLKNHEILSNKKLLCFLSNIFRYHNDHWINYFSDSSLIERLKKILAQFIFAETDILKEATLDQLADKSHSSNYNTDDLCYTSYCLNGNKSFDILNDDFKAYLYIVVRLNAPIGGIIHYDKGERLGDKAFRFDALISYFKLLYKHHADFLSNYFDDITNKLSIVDFDIMLGVVGMPANKQDNVISSAILGWGVYLDVTELEIIKEQLTRIKLEDKKILEKCESVIKFRKTNSQFSKTDILNLFEILCELPNRFEYLCSSDKIEILDVLMTYFCSEKSVEFKSGFMSTKDWCVDFLKYSALTLLPDEELDLLLNKLKEKRNSDIWVLRIQDEKRMRSKKDAENDYESITIEKLKEFIQNQGIISNQCFFAYVTEEVEKLARLIERNEENEKKLFYEKNNSSEENRCRDLFLAMLHPVIEKNAIFVREKNIGVNRVDLNIRYKRNDRFNVRIECKRANHGELKSAVKTQLIDQYMQDGDTTGIYLIFRFNFRDKTFESKLKEIRDNIPERDRYRVEVIVIDLRLPESIVK